MVVLKSSTPSFQCCAGTMGARQHLEDTLGHSVDAGFGVAQVTSVHMPLENVVHVHITVQESRDVYFRKREALSN